MFSWFTSFFRSTTKKTSTEQLNELENLAIFKPEDKGLFEYWNGEKLIAADPMALYRKLMTKALEIDNCYKVATSQSTAAINYYDDLVKTIRLIFEVKQFTEGGLTDDLCVKLLDCFLVFVDDVKKNWSIVPTLPKETPSAPRSSSGDDSTTLNTSASGSTKTDKNSEPLLSSPSGSVSPLV